MAKKGKLKNFIQAADRADDYLAVHRKQVLRYLAAAVATGIMQIILEWLLFSMGIGTLLPFFLRGILLFILAKFWVYKEMGSGGFYTARQIMLAFMLILIASTLINALTVALMGVVSGSAFIRYIGQGVLELLYFLMYQFIIFKEPKNG